jgi:hypothetical protein
MSKKKGGDDGVSFARLAELVGGDPLELEHLKLAGKGLGEIPDLFPCKRLRRVDIAGNELDSLECVSGLRYECLSLSLSLSLSVCSSASFPPAPASA